MNIQELTIKYLDLNPYIKNTLRNDLVNYSKLSRLIIKDNKLNDNNFDAILISLRRIKDSLKKNFKKKVNSLLKNTSTRIENKISVIITDNYVHPDTLNEIRKKDNSMIVIEGYSGKTIIASSQIKDFIEKKIKKHILKIQDKQVKITLISPENLEIIPGVISHIYSLLSENNINITETMSCFKDTILILNEKDLYKAMTLLN